MLYLIILTFISLVFSGLYFCHVLRKILLTGANGYIGMRLLPLLLQEGHEVVCAVRSADRFSVDEEVKRKLKIVEVDFLKPVQAGIFPKDIDAAYFLIHSMTASTSNSDEKEAASAENFNIYAHDLNLKQVIFLTGMTRKEEMSKHLESRQHVAQILKNGNFELTCLQAGIIVGSGSSSFEIIWDLCEKLPFMITPKWVNTKTEPIAIRDALTYLTNVLGNEKTYRCFFDISGPETLTYRSMMEKYCKVRDLQWHIVCVPFMTPRLSSYWLYFVTSTSYHLAVNLVDSMTVEVTSNDKRMQKMLNVDSISYSEAIGLAFDKIEQNQVVSSWKDSKISGRFSATDLNAYLKVPTHGCLTDVQIQKAENPEKALEKIWAIGGEKGWYYANFLWKFHGFFDKLFGGVGLRRGRTRSDKLYAGDALDFWRVLYANKEKKRLLLFAEMKVPGEAWLEFFIDDQQNVHQIATFRPRGIWGRLYWYSRLPFHYFIFKGMLSEIIKS